jgi:hypothetical protein
LIKRADARNPMLKPDYQIEIYDLIDESLCLHIESTNFEQVQNALQAISKEKFYEKLSIKPALRFNDIHHSQMLLIKPVKGYMLLSAAQTSDLSIPVEKGGSINYGVFGLIAQELSKRLSIECKLFFTTSSDSRIAYNVYNSGNLIREYHYTFDSEVVLDKGQPLAFEKVVYQIKKGQFDEKIKKKMIRSSDISWQRDDIHHILLVEIDEVIKALKISKKYEIKDVLTLHLK